MPHKSNREFKELIEIVYEQKFNEKDYIKRMLEEMKVIPSFFYDDSIQEMRIELKEDETTNETTSLNQFYNDLQNIQENKVKEITIQIDCDAQIYKKVLSQYVDIIHFVNKPNTKYYTKKYFKEKILVELQALEDILEYAMK